MRFVRGLLQFCYDFVIGDDWKIAAAVVSVLLVGAFVVSGGSYDSVLLAPVLALGVAASFTTALLIDVRAKKGRR